MTTKVFKAHGGTVEMSNRRYMRWLGRKQPKLGLRLNAIVTRFASTSTGGMSKWREVELTVYLFGPFGWHSHLQWAFKLGGGRP